MKSNVLSAMVYCLASITPLAVFAIPGDITQALLQITSERHAVSTDNLKIVNEASIILKYINRNLIAAKIMDKKSDKMYQVAIDSNGQPVDLEALIAADNAVKKRLFGISRDFKFI